MNMYDEDDDLATSMLKSAGYKVNLTPLPRNNMTTREIMEHRLSGYDDEMNPIMPKPNAYATQTPQNYQTPMPEKNMGWGNNEKNVFSSALPIQQTSAWKNNKINSTYASQTSQHGMLQDMDNEISDTTYTQNNGDYLKNFISKPIQGGIQSIDKEIDAWKRVWNGRNEFKYMNHTGTEVTGNQTFDKLYNPHINKAIAAVVPGKLNKILVKKFSSVPQWGAEIAKLQKSYEKNYK